MLVFKRYVTLLSAIVIGMVIAVGLTVLIWNLSAR